MVAGKAEVAAKAVRPFRRFHSSTGEHVLLSFPRSSVIPTFFCHSEERSDEESLRVCHHLPPGFPTADPSLTLGMTREKGVIPRTPPLCHSEERSDEESLRVCHHLPPGFPTADPSLTLGMTREKGVIPRTPPLCHSEERSDEESLRACLSPLPALFARCNFLYEIRPRRATGLTPWAQNASRSTRWAIASHTRTVPRSRLPQVITAPPDTVTPGGPARATRSSPPAPARCISGR